MRSCILFIVCVLNSTLAVAAPVVVETRLLRVEGSLIIETNNGSTDIQIDTIKAFRVHNGKSEIKLLNDVVIILSNLPGKVDTAWEELPAETPRPKRRQTSSPGANKKKNGSATNLQAYAKELVDLVSKARPGVESTRDAADVRSVEFLIRELNKAIASGKSQPSLLRQSPFLERVRSLARVASQRVVTRNRAIGERNQQLRDIQIEIRVLSQQQQANQTFLTDSTIVLLSKQRRRSQIDREIKRLKSKEKKLRKVAKEAATQHQMWQEKSQP